MSNRLILVRHAKSSWDDESLADHDRPLNDRGRKALGRMADHLRGLGIGDVRVLCSTARRTVATLDGIRDAIPAADVELDRTLYHADADAVLDRLRTIAGDRSTVMVVGHNPTLQDLACSLIGSGDRAQREQLARKLPTGSIVTMEFSGPWPVLRPGATTLVGVFTPRSPRD